MKFAIALLLLFVPAFAADDVHDVTSVMNTWKTAMLKGDAATLDKLYHKDLSYTHSSAKVENKAEAIAGATAPASITKAIELRDVVTHVFGNTAVVRAKGDLTSANGTVNRLELLIWSDLVKPPINEGLIG